MLKQILLFVFLATGILVKAQYKNGDWYVSPKISFADFSDRNDWAGYSISKVPPISITVEHGLNDFFSTGLIVGFSNDKYTNDTLKTNVHRYTNLAIGGLATIHFAGWIEKWSNYSVFLGDWDFYLTGGLMMEWENRDETDVWNESKQVFEDLEYSEFNFKVRPAIGVRYYVTDNFCMLLEVGKANLGLVTTGVSWRL